jgi:hypothetical protein
LKVQTEAIEPSGGHHSSDLTLWTQRARTCGRRSPNVPILIRQALHAVGMPIVDHDVSGTGWQTLGRAMQSITTMVPVWQCGHSRNDCPVNASKRSR